jgi:hypothetical protein
MKLLLLIFGLVICGSALASKDSDCVVLAHLMESATKLKNLHLPEAQIIAESAAQPADKLGKSAAQLRSLAQMDARVSKIIAYIFTVDQDVKTARAVGYRKCMAGDFE